MAKETAAEGKKAAAKAKKRAAKQTAAAAKKTVAKEAEDKDPEAMETSSVLSTSDGEEVESVLTNMVTAVERTTGAATPTHIPDAGTGAVRPVSLASRRGTRNQVAVSNPRKRRCGILQDDNDDDNVIMLITSNISNLVASFVQHSG
ncbi:hypothetical protein PI124_g18769 [Phytophthora idaei]|nr:hypothetical protein PI125_g17035 [Phytophthora idaei]KAG3149838.1 hypothetical protein PI126_g11828 [Phytophthora idaei]KAG3236224.1 hypothetical protein PI124_g18769 [Phytophthora idaei]